MQQFLSSKETSIFNNHLWLSHSVLEHFNSDSEPP